MTFLDANIFLYAIGAPHPMRAPCAEVLHRVGNGRFAATMNTEVLQEVLHVMLRKGQRTEALRVAQRVIKIFPNMLPVTREDMVEAASLLGQVQELECRDAIHAATMIRNGIGQIMSLDPDFDRIPGIRRITPQ